MPLPPAAVHLRPQLDQYEDMARFLGYSSSTASQPTSQQDRSNHSQTSSQFGFPSAANGQLPPAAPLQAAPASHIGLYPNDHAMHLPAVTPFRASPVPASTSSNPWDSLQQRAGSSSSSSGTSSSSRSHHSPHRQQQPDRQLQTPAARVAPSPFMASAEHSFAPVVAFASPFMADAEHSFVPTPVQAPPQNTWEAFGSPTFPEVSHTGMDTNSNTGAPQMQQPLPEYTARNGPNGIASPPTSYFSYLDLLGPGQSSNPQTLSQQQYLQQHQQHEQHQQQHRQHQQHSHSNSRGRQQHQQDRHQHRQENQHYQQQHRHNRDKHRQQHQSERNQHQAQLQQQARESPGRQPSFSQQPTGTNSDPLPVSGVNAHSAFDSFDPEGPEGVLTVSLSDCVVCVCVSPFVV